MSHAHFLRKNIISACTASLDDIYSIRLAKLEESEKELAAFEKRLTDRNWWKAFLFGNDMGDSFARCRLEEVIRNNGDWYKNHEKRLKVMLAFCIVLEDVTISITAQEFKDFSKFYKG